MRKAIEIGGEGGWDILKVDPEARRLYVSHSTKVEVVDLDKEAVIGQIDDTPGVHDIAVAPKLSRAFTTNGRENKVSVVDLKTFKTLQKVDTGENPDVILFDDASGEVYAFNGHGNSVTVIDAATAKVIATIALPGKPEFAVSDPAAGRIYCNLEDASKVAAIDTKTHAVAAVWPAAPGESPSGLAIDREHGRLFLGCDNQMMVMMSSKTGEVLSKTPIGKGIDGTGFDPNLGLAFASSGEGALWIAREDPAGTLSPVQTLPTQKGARTMALDPTTHRVYLPTAEFEPAAPGERRPRAKAGTFKILVCEPK